MAEDGRIRCWVCRRRRPAEDFPPSRRTPGQALCRDCHRVRMRLYRERPEVKERERLRRLTDPEFRERAVARARAWQRAHPERIREIRSSLTYRLNACRRNARSKLKRATDPARREALNNLIAMYEAELARLARKGA